VAERGVKTLDDYMLSGDRLRNSSVWPDSSWDARLEGSL